MHHIPWDIIVTIVVTMLASSGFWSVIQYKMARKDKLRSTLEEGVVALLHDRIYRAAGTYLERGYITVKELDNLEYLYRPYKEMGGNGTGEQLYSDVQKLPKRPD